MRWCRNLYAPLDQGSVNPGHPEARQKRPSIASTSAHAADTRGWVDRRSRQGYFLVGRSPLNAGFARPLAARPRSPTLPSGANSGLLCGMPNSAPKLAWFLHTRTPPGGLFSGGSRGFGSMALTGPSLGLPANLFRWRWRPIRDSPWRVPTDVDSTFCAEHRGEASRSSRAPSADVEFDPV